MEATGADGLMDGWMDVWMDVVAADDVSMMGTRGGGRGLSRHTLRKHELRRRRKETSVDVLCALVALGCLAVGLG